MLKVNTLNQGTQEWEDWRSFGIGSSDVPVIMGVSEYKSRWELWAEKLGIKTPTDLSRNPHVRRGNFFEPLVRKSIEMKLGVKLNVYCAEDDVYPWRKVSFDGVALINGESIPTEIKCPCLTHFDDLIENGLKSKLALMHLPQLHYQMGLLDAPYGYLVFYFEENNTLKIYRVVKDLDIQTSIFDSVDRFFTQNIQNATAPEKDPNMDYYEPGEKELIQWDQETITFFELQKEESDLRKRLKEVSTEKKELAEKLTGIASEFKQLSLHGVKITTVKGKKSFLYDEFLASKGVEITDEERAKFTSIGKPSYRISAIRNRKDLDKIENRVIQNQRQQALTLFDAISRDDQYEDESYFA
ncbi:lambda-exonuclease family protein [Vibrio sp. 1180_3]|uniref:lambda-exonuclease family protein n=1 Tax=Vibrio sp. 1180_3 TaxID=2528832 RepID=UPI0024051033|nr:YqaJ viral recombinase family protein [Vibrio sp. 1180_3]MDF9399151.1 hypothetical protein [Vibrio sp. 1180_3]